MAEQPKKKPEKKAESSAPTPITLPRDKKSLQELTALLSSGDRMGQIRAALDLADQNTQVAQQALISALNNSSEHSRACAVMAIAKIRLMGAVPTLVRQLKGNQLGFFKDRSAEVRQAVAFALGEIGGPLALKTLQFARERDEAEVVRVECTQALEKLGALTKSSA